MNRITYPAFWRNSEAWIVARAKMEVEAIEAFLLLGGQDTRTMWELYDKCENIIKRAEGCRGK